MGFRFLPKEREVEVEGRRFTIRIGDLRTIEAIMSSAETAEASRPPAGSEHRLVCLRLAEQIKAIIGKDGYEAVFDGREVNYLDHMELVKFLSDEMGELTRQRERALLGNVEPPEIVGTTSDDSD